MLLTTSYPFKPGGPHMKAWTGMLSVLLLIGITDAFAQGKTTSRQEHCTVSYDQFVDRMKAGYDRVQSQQARSASSTARSSGQRSLESGSNKASSSSQRTLESGYRDLVARCPGHADQLIRHGVEGSADQEKAVDQNAGLGKRLLQTLASKGESRQSTPEQQAYNRRLQHWVASLR